MNEKIERVIFDLLRVFDTISKSSIYERAKKRYSLNLDPFGEKCIEYLVYKDWYRFQKKGQTYFFHTENNESRQLIDPHYYHQLLKDFSSLLLDNKNIIDENDQLKSNNIFSLKENLIINFKQFHSLPMSFIQQILNLNQVEISELGRKLMQEFLKFNAHDIKINSDIQLMILYRKLWYENFDFNITELNNLQKDFFWLTDEHIDSLLKFNQQWIEWMNLINGLDPIKPHELELIKNKISQSVNSFIS